MRANKADRDQVFTMFGGLCAYCGVKLPERWHVDHVESVRRNDYLGRPPERPENHRLDNMFPACPPCNLDKGSMPLESWREWLSVHVQQLNRLSIFKLAKAHGLIAETGAPIVFYFERAPPPITKGE